MVIARNRRVRLFFPRRLHLTRGLKPACVEICPTEARIFGDLKNPVTNDPIQRFIQQNKVQSLKPHLGTEPRVLYAGMDKEVR